MAGLKLESVRKSFGELAVIHSVDLDIDSGEFVVFVGPSGCGKSTLLRMIAGLEEVTDGEIAIKGRDVTDVDPSQRGIAMVFQSYALYPHMTVRDNLAFGLKMQRTEKAVIDERVAAAAAILKIEQLLDRRPGQLSGGQRQRVAIARAVAMRPPLILADEPTANLDDVACAAVIALLASQAQQAGATLIIASHDARMLAALPDAAVLRLPLMQVAA